MSLRFIVGRGMLGMLRINMQVLRARAPTETVRSMDSNSMARGVVDGMEWSFTKSSGDAHTRTQILQFMVMHYVRRCRRTLVWRYRRVYARHCHGLGVHDGTVITRMISVGQFVMIVSPSSHRNRDIRASRRHLTDCSQKLTYIPDIGISVNYGM